MAEHRIQDGWSGSIQTLKSQGAKAVLLNILLSPVHLKDRYIPISSNNFLSSGFLCRVRKREVAFRMVPPPRALAHHAGLSSLSIQRGLPDLLTWSPSLHCYSPSWPFVYLLNRPIHTL